MESIIYNELHASAKSKFLAGNIIAALTEMPSLHMSTDFWKALATALARKLNGDDLCNELGLMKPGLDYKPLGRALCGFFRVTGFLARHNVGDKQLIRVCRPHLYTLNNVPGFS